MGFQKILNISYADKFLNEIQKRFRDEFRNDLSDSKSSDEKFLFIEISTYFLLENYNRTYPFRISYEKVLKAVEDADDAAKRVHRAPRSFDESDKKLKNEKIVTKKSDAVADENKKKKTAKPKVMATKIVQEEVEQEEEEVEEDDVEIEVEEEQKEEEKNTIEDRVPLEELQQTAMSTRDKLAAMDKKPAPFSKASTR